MSKPLPKDFTGVAVPVGASRHRAEQETLALTIGMPTYDDFSGVFFSIQDLIRSHTEAIKRCELLVVDNHATKETIEYFEDTLRFPRKYFGLVSYVPCADSPGPAAAKNKVFEAAKSRNVLCMDSHVLLGCGYNGEAYPSVEMLIDFYAKHPKTLDLYSGPTIIGDGIYIHTGSESIDYHWQGDSRCDDLLGEPFEVASFNGHLYTCRKEAWLGFNKDFRGYGAEEHYIQAKYRKAGHRSMCLPFLRNIHKFRYWKVEPSLFPLDAWDQERNLVLGRMELGESLDIVRKHCSWMSEEDWQYLISDPVRHILPLSQKSSPQQLKYSAEIDKRENHVTEAARKEAICRACEHWKNGCSLYGLCESKVRTLRTMWQLPNSKCLAIHNLPGADGIDRWAKGRLPIVVERKPTLRHGYDKTKCNKPFMAFWHVAAMGNWKAVVKEQLALFNKVGITPLAYLIGKKADEAWLRERSPVLYLSEDFTQYETPTIAALWQWSREVPDGIALYCHTKGVSKPNRQRTAWRRLMELHVIYQWAENVKLLETADAVGVDWRTGELDWKADAGFKFPHFQGNFWMARNDYVAKLMPPWAHRESREWPAFCGPRLHAEMWIGQLPEIRPVSLACTNVDLWRSRLVYQLLAEAIERWPEAGIAGAPKERHGPTKRIYTAQSPLLARRLRNPRSLAAKAVRA